VLLHERSCATFTWFIYKQTTAFVLDAHHKWEMMFFVCANVRFPFGDQRCSVLRKERTDGKKESP